MGLVVAKKPPADLPNCLSREECRMIIRDTNKMLVYGRAYPAATAKT